MAELVAEDAEGAGGVGEASGDLGAGDFDEVSAKGFVLAMEGVFGGEEKVGFCRMRYLITRIDNHSYILLHNNAKCQDIVGKSPEPTIYCAQ